VFPTTCNENNGCEISRSTCVVRGRIRQRNDGARVCIARTRKDVLCDLTPYSLAKLCCRFRSSCCIHHQIYPDDGACRYACTRQHDVTPPKNKLIFKVTTVRTSGLASYITCPSLQSPLDTLTLIMYGQHHIPPTASQHNSLQPPATSSPLGTNSPLSTLLPSSPHQHYCQQPQTVPSAPCSQAAPISTTVSSPHQHYCQQPHSAALQNNAWNNFAFYSCGIYRADGEMKTC
jgi:hypothetical protein